MSKNKRNFDTNNIFNQCKKTWSKIKNFFSEDESGEYEVECLSGGQASGGFLAMAQSLEQKMKKDADKAEQVKNTATHIAASFVAKKYFDGDQETSNYIHKLADLLVGKEANEDEAY